VPQFSDVVWHFPVIAGRDMRQLLVTYRYFENLRTITAYVVFADWPHLLRGIAAADPRPP
jgi:hypothetical protein